MPLTPFRLSTKNSRSEKLNIEKNEQLTPNDMVTEGISNLIETHVNSV